MRDEGLNEGLNELYDAIDKNPGIQRHELGDKLNKSQSTLDKQLKKLTEAKLIERRGSRKTGGDWVVDKENRGK